MSSPIRSLRTEVMLTRHATPAMGPVIRTVIESLGRDALGVDGGGQDSGDSAGLVEHVVADGERVPVQPTEPGCA